MGKDKVSNNGLPYRCSERRSAGMAHVKVYYDRQGNTLTVWFEDPKREHVCEETGDEIVLMKDRTGKVIGFEKLNFVEEQTTPLQVDLKPSRSDR